MTHTTKVIREAQVSDEDMAVTIRCCDNPKTDSTMTIHGFYKLTAAQLDTAYNKHHDRVAAKCQGMDIGKQLLVSAVTRTKTHEVK